jgi:hypothetical protein
MDADKLVRLRVDAPGVRPETVSTVDALGLATAYFNALQKLAEDRGLELVLQGVEVSDGSLNIAARSDKPEVAKESLRVLAGGLSSEGKTSVAVRDVVVWLRRFKNAKVQAWVGSDFERDLSVDTALKAPIYWATVSLRATPQRVGGATPRVRFTSPSEQYPFTLDVDAENARAVGANLYREMDIEARVKGIWRAFSRSARATLWRSGANGIRRTAPIWMKRMICCLRSGGAMMKDPR